MTSHLISCLWIITATMDEDPQNWVDQYESSSRTDLYLTSFYFTITTITTVGYGDFQATTFFEKIVCILIMVAGVIAFSFASGTLTNYIQQQDRKNLLYEDKILMLDRLFKKHDIPTGLYSQIK